VLPAKRTTVDFTASESVNLNFEDGASGTVTTPSPETLRLSGTFRRARCLSQGRCSLSGLFRGQGVQLVLQIACIPRLAGDLQQLVDHRQEEVQRPHPGQRVTLPKGAPRHGYHHRVPDNFQWNTSPEQCSRTRSVTS
jgi:hypothetical protein